MPPKSPNKPGSVGQKMFTADTVAALLVALDNPVITRDQLNLMSALDGTRTADAFQHQMRPVVSKAKELKAKIKAGEVFLPIKSSSKKRGGMLTPIPISLYTDDGREEGRGKLGIG
ncbi:hypothetical protein GQ43DRAFT_374510 [Delitschia confertaspora ATCC 74209]|uniref:Uncharacterized protein n=1 Tax=Delitschia confertaspora ATCC 74209 TaxID=1513339 RepID=A0A9P4MRP9_9PLEO|nr:hypothetical protein GQ43DRAFT_374510 [Delitschia confertaspora ATCC 74209]